MNQILDQFAKQPLSVKIIFLVVILVIIGGLEYQMQYVPLKDQLRLLGKKKADLQAKLVENQAVADNLPIFQEEVNVLNEQLKQAVSLLPNEADIQAILRQLSNMAKKNGVAFLYFRPGGISSRGFYSEISMNLKLDGRYNDIATYIDQVGKLSRIINMSNINFSNIRPDGRVMRMTVDLLATTFMFRGGR